MAPPAAAAAAEKRTAVSDGNNTNVSLPRKKRKTSNASSSNASSSKAGGEASSNTVATAADPATAAASRMIRESRLPRKKRKESYADSLTILHQQQQQQQQQTAAAAGATGGSSSVSTRSSSRLRKGSQDSSAKESNHSANTVLASAADADANIDNALLPSPVRKASQDSSITLQPLDDLLGVSAKESFSVSNATSDDAPVAVAVASALAGTEPLHNEDEDGGGDGKPAASQAAVAPAKNQKDTMNNGSSALDHLEALNDSKKPAAAAAKSPLPKQQQQQQEKQDQQQQQQDDSSNSFASSGHRLLMEAIMMTSSTAAAGGGGTGNTSERSGSGTTAAAAAATRAPVGRERLDSFPPALGGSGGGGRERLDSFPPHQGSGSGGGGGRERLDSYVRERLDSQTFQGARDRLESWGGMSDLSIPVGESLMASAMVAASNLHQGNLLLDADPAAAAAAPAAAAGDIDRKPNAIPSRISLQRDRLNSVASLSEASVSGMMVDGVDMSAGDLQAFVAAAMASVGNQISELAGAVEDVAAAAGGGDSVGLEDLRREMGVESDEASSGAPPIIGAAHDAGAARRPRSWSTSSGKISVDLDAVQAAVAAAEAASGSLGLSGSTSSSTNPKMAPPPQKVSSLSVKPASRGERSRVSRRSLPLKRTRAGSNSSSGASGDVTPRTKNERKAPASRAKGAKTTNKKKTKRVPLKKRVKRTSPEPDGVKSSASTMPTPKVTDRSIAASAGLQILPPVVKSSSLSAAAAKPSLAKEKWEGFFTAMVDFADERRAEETKNMSADEKKNWVWDGHVPTNYKTKDGKALGRWINNQRSAHAKGSLKKDREERLVSAGLRWSVLATKNAFDDMLKELEIYIDEQAKQGIQWDGNVPTHYQIKKRADDGEDKNLGRWVNRQRSLYQAGKLREDRQKALEKLGLKWSMMVSTSWESMFESLKLYAAEMKEKNGGKWDGNVPATYKTKDDPPLSLGRWINRQRAAYAKKTLKKEYVDKLSALGFRWSVYGSQDGVVGDEDVGGAADGDKGASSAKNGDNNSKGGDTSGKENAEELVKPKESESAAAPAAAAPEEAVEAPKEPTTERAIGVTSHLV